MKPHDKQRSGFSLIELLSVAVILATVIAGLIVYYSNSLKFCILLQEQAMALAEAQTLLEEVRGHEFTTIQQDYSNGGTPGNSFDLMGLKGKAVITVNQIEDGLLALRVVVCWETRGETKVIGEDANLDGVLSVSEDANGNGKMDSAIVLETLLTEKVQ